MHVSVDLINKATPAEFGTLLEELEPYCAARHEPTAGWLETAIDQREPAYGQAKRNLQQASKARAVIESNAGRPRDAVTNGIPRPTLVMASAAKYDPDK